MDGQYDDSTDINVSIKNAIQEEEGFRDTFSRSVLDYMICWIYPIQNVQNRISNASRDFIQKSIEGITCDRCKSEEELERTFVMISTSINSRIDT